MRTWFGWYALAFGLVCVPTANAAIYKCTVKGSTVYQDQPCSSARPDEGKLAVRGTPSDDDVTGDSPAALIQGIRRLGERERQMDAQRDRAQAQLKARMSAVTDEQVQRREVAAFQHDWRERFAENRRQREALLARLKQLCPGGASSRAGEVTCHK